MSRMRQFSFLDTLLQPTKSRGIAQSTKSLHIFGSDVVVILEILHEQTVDFNVTDVIRTLRIFSTQELCRTQFSQQFIVGFIHYSFKLDAFRTNLMFITNGVKFIIM